jgi:hypothetical protein
MEKSSNHSKITGDFAEALVLYWLSKYGYECARIDHTGIDLIARVPKWLIARDPNGPEVLGISVKCLSRYPGTEKESVNLPKDGFDKARSACEVFRCVPYYAIVVDGADFIRSFVLPLSHVEVVAGGRIGEMRYWQMSDQCLDKYYADPLIKRFEIQTSDCSWRDESAK